MPDLQRMLTNMEDLRANLQQTKDSVLLQGKQLLEVTGRKAAKDGGGGGGGSPVVPRKGSLTLVVVPSPSSASSSSHQEEGEVSKLLVTPKYTRANLSSTTSSPPESRANVPAASTDQSILEAISEQLSSRHKQLMDLWTSRRGRLEQAKKALEFTEAVARVMAWLENEGSKFLPGGHDYGRSVEEVQGLMEAQEGFWERNVRGMEEEMGRLAAVYRGLEEGGCTELNQIRTLNGGLQQKWGAFRKDLTSRMANLVLSLEFQNLLIEVGVCV